MYTPVGALSEVTIAMAKKIGQVEAFRVICSTEKFAAE